MKMEEEELLGEGKGRDQVDEVPMSHWSCFVKDDGKSCIGDEGDGDGRVFKVMEMVRWDGSVFGIKWLVILLAKEELHRNGK